MASYVAMQQITRGFLKWSPVVTSFKTSRHGNDVQDSDAIEVLVPMEVGKQQGHQCGEEMGYNKEMKGLY